MMLSHTLTIEQTTALSLNSGHGDKYARNQVVQDVKEDVRWLANGATPVATPCTIDVTLVQRTRQRRDPDNIPPLSKPIIDAIVAAGVVPDDSFKHVAAVTYRVAVDPDVKSGTVRLDVTVTPCEVDA